MSDKDTAGSFAVGIDEAQTFKKRMPSPTQEDLDDPVFEALWQTIKTWDVNVPEYYVGYCGANGSHVKLLLDSFWPQIRDRLRAAEAELARLKGTTDD